MIVINLLILALFLLLWFLSRNYEKEFISNLDDKKYKQKAFYPMAFYIMDKLTILRNNFKFTKQEEALKGIYVGEQIEVVKKLYLCNKVVVILLILGIFNILSLFSNIHAKQRKELMDGNYIKRPAISEGSKKISLDVHITEDDLTVLIDEIQLEIYEEQYNEEELNEQILLAKEYIDSNLLKDNKAFDEIISDLNFVSWIPGTGLSVEWTTEDYQLITRDGKVKNENINDGIATWVIANITYYDIQIEYVIYLRLLPKVYAKEELVQKELAERIDEINENTITEDKFQLPDSVGKGKVNWNEKEDSSGLTFLFMGLITAIVIFIASDKDLYEKLEKRNRQLLLDYPEIINKLTLLLGAGMPLANAWHKIVQDYKEKSKEKRFAYEEMLITSNELMLGISEITAYERFGRRVKLLPYLRFASLIAQNVKKGSSDLLRLLELEGVEAFEERKELAKRIGEEAGTKLLMPMMLMLLVVLVIIIVPAFLSFSI